MTVSISQSVADKECVQRLLESSWCGVLSAMSLLLDASTDDSSTENILKHLETFASFCGKSKLTGPRDAYLAAICKVGPHPQTLFTSGIHALSCPFTGQPAATLHPQRAEGHSLYPECLRSLEGPLWRRLRTLGVRSSLRCGGRIRYQTPSGRRWNATVRINLEILATCF